MSYLFWDLSALSLAVSVLWFSQKSPAPPLSLSPHLCAPYYPSKIIKKTKMVRERDSVSAGAVRRADVRGGATVERRTERSRREGRDVCV